MTIKQQLIEEVSKCLEDAVPLINYLQEKKNNNDYSFHLEYQKWYSKVIKVIEFLAPDRYSEFKSYYEVDTKRKLIGYGTYVIQDYIKGIVPRGSIYANFNIKEQALKNLYNQYTILVSVVDRASSLLSDLQTELFIELQDLELETAISLLKVNVRSAGVIAGVVLEGYLSKIVKKHNIEISKKHPTLSDFNELLKSKKIYDTLVWRKISYLTDIRNTCAHLKQTEPTKEQVNELIEGTNWVIKNVF